MDEIFASKRTIAHVKENDAIAIERKLVFSRYILDQYAVSFGQDFEPFLRYSQALDQGSMRLRIASRHQQVNLQN